jgi:FkbM family methyltransferase
MTNDSPPASLGEIIGLLPGIAAHHARNTDTYRVLDERTKELVMISGLAKSSEEATPIGDFGSIVFPFARMGAISTLDLFGLDELIIFSFYWANRRRYRNVADIGANLGIHSILMGKCGWNVSAYEPDPEHVKILRRNLELNNSFNVNLIEAAVSDKPGTLEFVRVLGNTTSSHLAGAKNNAYGSLERFPVRVESISSLMDTVDFIKMDAEGQEKVIILGTNSSHWIDTDMIVEIGSEENAIAIYEHLQLIGVNAFAQKLGWHQVRAYEDMPTHYKHGSLFITKKPEMPWVES